MKGRRNKNAGESKNSLQNEDVKIALDKANKALEHYKTLVEDKCEGESKAADAYLDEAINVLNTVYYNR